ncbi:toprim [Streptococcus chenjunshii]|uniref:Toprim n=1 Tax=Streptococcus chenjunshii TaxID=2173853 RepID=A0A372KPH1_9STRE|nr:PBECR4 domain-containing protein [Streptococcus chenjunshii]AXQ78568.1 toprim [Streptococcus chenjunshii]RFU51969.1 toprim [Streptococcus chenjunshii]RFU54161.1 toprim [Streptococcus chenjunshii]
MAEEHTQQSSSRGKSRRERVEYARSRDILDVASEMNMELVRSGRDYRWKEHDSMVISPDKNMWNWFSRHQGGDVISLVETMKEVNFNQAIDYLNDGSFKEYTVVERVQEPFSYYLEPYEQPFEAARTYLKEQRSLSDETIDFFLDKGVLAQANAKVNGSIEPVVVFKSFDFSGEIVGATLQGIEENWEKWPERGYAKNIVRNSDGVTGMHVDIGQPNRLIFAESAIDLMSYYELHKDNLQDVRLVSMDGLKEAVIGKHLAQLQADILGRPLHWSHDQLADGLQTAIDNNFFTDGKHADWITLAVDNDEAGRNFTNSLREKGASIVEDLPVLQPGQDKTDWNDALKQHRILSLSDDRESYQTRSEKQGVLFENLADVTSTSDRAQVSYDTFKANQERLSEAVQSQIRAGNLRVTLSDEAYFYTLVNYTGWSHPMQQLKPKAIDSLKEYRTFFESINDTNIDHFKEKGTPEQNQMYDILKSLQKDLGRSNTSTVFSEEVAISAYNLNRQLDSLTAENWGRSISDPLGNLGRDTWNIISYPANEIVTGNVDYYYQLVPYHLLDYLNNKSGTVEISPETYETILQKLRDEAIIITPEVVEEVTMSPEQVVSSVEETEKPLDNHQEAAVSSEQYKKNETNIRDLSEQAQEAAPLPEATPSQPLKDLSPSQTDSHSLLYFTIEDPKRSIYKDNYHPIKPHELNKLNHHAPNIQSAAQWYLDNLSDTTLHYFYQQGNKQYNINIDFEQYHFMHLTGLFPLKRGQTAVKTLHDFAEGRGSYDNLMIADNEAAFQKIKVLPDLKAIMETDAFYFDQVEDIPKLQSLSLEKAIKSDDKDVLLAFSSNEENIYPASLMELTKQLKIQTEQSQHQNVILGVYQERDGKFTQLSINEAYITDNGEEMLSILKSGQVSSDEPSHDLTPSPAEALIDAATFTKVLDTAYNVGNPAELGVEVPEEFQASWERYNQLSEESSGDFKTIVAKADGVGLLDKTTAFYQDWQQDQIYNDTYHVRLRSSNERPNSPQLPFEPTHLVSYQDFVTVLYKANQDASRTKPIAFDIYAPGGVLVKEDVRYAIGDETQPVSHLLGLGYRRLEGYPDLAAIDEEVLSQLENQAITTEENGQTIVTGNSPEGLYKQEEIDAFLTNNGGQEPSQRTQENISSAEPFDYKSASAYEISERAFQKIREYTQSPEDLMEYVEFMSKFPQLSPRNVALIQEQWRGANAVATYDQWKSMGEALGIKTEDVIQTKATYVNKRTGESKEVVHQGLSVKAGEKSRITLFRPLMARMIPVLDENGHQVKNNKGNPKYKKLSEATSQEKTLVKDGKLPVRQFQERDPKTGQPRFTTYKVFELSQTTLKPESYPKAMPNRHYNFDTDKVKTKEVLEGLCDYAESIGVSIMKDEAHVLGNAKGAFFPGEQLILINPDNTPGEKIATTIHELAHATLHNPNLADQYKELPKVQKELEAEMTSHLLSKHFGLDTTEKAIDYMAKWTDNLQGLNDKQLADSLKRIHKTVSKMHKQIEHHTKPYQLGKNRGQGPNFPKAPIKGPSR